MNKSSKKTKQNYKKLRLILILSTLIILILASIYEITKLKKQNTFSESEKYVVKGIDLSHHNPIIKWEDVRLQGIHFAYIKATEGISHLDRNYPFNYKLAKDNNIKIGAYHFFSFDVPGKEQALFFIKTANLQKGDLYPVIDVEHSPANIYSKDTLYQKNIIHELIDLENTLYEYYGIHPIIYTNMDCYKIYIKRRLPENLIWISSINKEPTKDIPNWIIWQFTHQGKLNGLAENIDLNYFRYSYQQLMDITIP